MTLSDLIPLIKYNDIVLMRGEEELCFIRKDYVEDMFSEKYLNMKVEYILNDEAMPDTIVVYLTEKDQEVFYADGKRVEEN